MSESSGGDIASRVQALTRSLERDRLPGVYDIVPSFTTVAAHFDPIAVGSDDPVERVMEWMRRRAQMAVRFPALAGREVRIPVCYGEEFGPDLERVAENAGLSTGEVVDRHAAALYTVRAIGFSPGFPYLSGLPAELRTPRRATPRASVPAGSVAIGGGQTGVYSRNSPGGWNLIGRTGLTLFDPEATPPSLLQVGDRVRFMPISAEALTASLT